MRVKFGCCRTKIGKIAFASDDRAITEAEQELGIGITIYFRQLKFFAMIFFLFTILSIPSYMLYGTGPSYGGGGF